MNSTSPSAPRWVAGAPAIGERLTARVRFFRAPIIDIASRDLRRRVQAGESIRYLVPEGVEQTILGRGLYR